MRLYSSASHHEYIKALESRVRFLYLLKDLGIKSAIVSARSAWEVYAGELTVGG